MGALFVALKNYTNIKLCLLSLVLFTGVALYADSPFRFVTWPNEDGTLTICDYDGRLPSRLVIPSSIDGKEVTGIWYEAFEDESLSEVLIPATITFIGEGAFCGESINYPQTTKATGAVSIKVDSGNPRYRMISGMLYDTYDKVVIAAEVGIKTAILPVDCTRVGENSFQAKHSLESVVPSPVLKTLGYKAFAECSKLKNVDFSNTLLESVEDKCFKDSWSLCSVVFPSSLSQIGESAFYEGDAPFFGKQAALASVSFMGPKPTCAGNQDKVFGGCKKLTFHIEDHPSWSNELRVGKWLGYPIKVSEKISVECAGLASGFLPMGIAAIGGGLAIVVDCATGVKSVGVAKLPTGMKYDAKSGLITGVPTKAGEYTVEFTVTTIGGNKAVFVQPLVVEPIPDAVVGTFNGFVFVGEDNLGTFTMTTTDTGKLTAKIVTTAGTVSFSGKCWDLLESGVYRATLQTKDETLEIAIDSNAAWNVAQLTGCYRTKSGRILNVDAQRNAFGKTWFFDASGDEKTGWSLVYAQSAKSAALTVTLKADGTTSIAGTLSGLPDDKGKPTNFKVSASGFVRVDALGSGVLIADFTPMLSVNKVKKVLSIKTNLWFDRSNDHSEGIGDAEFKEQF